MVRVRADKSCAGEVVQDLREHRCLIWIVAVKERAHERFLRFASPRVQLAYLGAVQPFCLFLLSHGTISSSRRSMSARE